SAYFHGALASDWEIKDKDNVDTQNQDGETILELLFASDDYVLQYFNWKDCFKEYLRNPVIPFDSRNKYLSLDKDTLILIHKHDGHEMEESEIWKQLIKWGI
ncbi:22666_t:CDS:2, partial [Gigaspora margarita]